MASLLDFPPAGGSKTAFRCQTRAIAAFYGLDPRLLYQRIHNFLHYIEVARPTAEKLAAKYDVQMFSRHRIRIDVEKTARLISCAREAVMPDLEDFFTYVEKQVRQGLSGR